jgi:UDP-glucose 4-epimerase
MKTLDLGGTGFIGSHVVDRLLAEGHSVRVLDRHPEAFRPALPGVDYRYGSFDHRPDLAEALEGMELVFHLVSTTHPKSSADDPLFDAQSNLLPSLVLFQECVAKKVRRVLYVSSGGAVYGQPDVLPAAEDAPQRPFSPYGATKLAVEAYLGVFRHEHGLESVVVRPSNAYGPRQSPQAKQGAIPVFQGRLQRGEAIDVWGDGSIVRDYVYVEDLAAGLVAAGLKGADGGVYNLGSGEGLSLIQVLQHIEAVTGRKPQLNFRGARRFDIPRIWLDVARAKRELGWVAQTKLDEGIRKTWDFVQGLKA